MTLTPDGETYGQGDGRKLRASMRTAVTGWAVSAHITRLCSVHPVARSSVVVCHREDVEYLLIEQVGHVVGEPCDWQVANREVRRHAVDECPGLGPGDGLLDGLVDRGQET